MDNNNLNEKEIMEKFRERILDSLEPENDNEYYISSWLSARDFDIEKAESMFRKHINFFKLNGLDKMEDYVPEEVTEYFHTKRLGYDKEGSLVRFLHLGATDIRGLAFSISTADSIKFAVHMLNMDSKTQKEERKNKPICHKQVYIFNLNGMNWRSIIHRTVTKRAFTLLKVYENNYPETLKIVYLVNAPSFFSFIYNWLKSVLPESIIDKVHVLSPENLQDAIKDTIDPSIIPASVGGKLVENDEDPECSSMFKKPLYTPVPEEFLPTKQFSALENDPLAKKVEIDNGLYFSIEAKVPAENSTLIWDFQTVQFDISFGLHYKENENSELKEIIPFHRVDSHLFPESGTFLCADAGIYVLVFDNRYSWFTKKILTYKVTVEKPYEEGKPN